MDAATGGQTGLKGRLGGENVAVDTGQSVLADAAEEISLHNSEKAESKHTAERKKEVAKPATLMSPEAIENYVNAAEGEKGAEKLAELAKRMLSGQGDPAKLARQRFGNPTSQYLAMQYALGQGEREGAPADVLERLREALDDLEMSHGPRIRADVNTIDAIAGGGASPAEVAGMQQTYTDMVMGKATLNQTLQLALERFGESDLAGGLARMTRALGLDLAAARPSTDAAHLQSLVQDLYHLGVASTVLDACKELHAKLGSQHGAMPGSPVGLMQDLVGISAEKWVAGSRFTTLSEKFGATGVEPQIHFLTGVKVLMRDMPLKVFVDADQRQTVFQAVQDALDTAIDREDY